MLTDGRTDKQTNGRKLARLCLPAKAGATKMRVVILVRDTSSWPVLHNYEVSWLYSKQFSSSGADTKLHLKPSRWNNSESMKARDAILVCDTSSWPVLHNYEVSWLYSKQFSSSGADTKLHLKPSRGNNSESMKARVVILVWDTWSWPVLHNWSIMSKFQRVFKLQSGHEYA